ncbi:MAG: putative cupin superfamily protein [Granulosicoccus sp.]|jgi:uncharacterized cupin superfamily protein
MSSSILKKSDIEAEEGVLKSHFLNKGAQRVDKSLGDLTGLTGFGIHLIEVPVGKESTELHMHYFEDECTYVVSGNGTVIIGEEKHNVSAGDFIAYPKGGEAHTMINTGEEVLKCLVVGERLAHDVVDYANKGKRFYRYQGQPSNLIDISAIETPVASVKTK